MRFSAALAAVGMMIGAGGCSSVPARPLPLTVVAAPETNPFLWRGPASFIDPGLLTLYVVTSPQVSEPIQQESHRLLEHSANIFRDVLSVIDKENPDLILVAGDIAEGRPRGMTNLKIAHEAMRPLQAPWLVIPGTHDQRYSTLFDGTEDGYTKAEFFKAFDGHGPDGRQGNWRYDVPDKGFTIIGLDSSREGTSEGMIDAEQIRWLDQTLRNVGRNRYVIVMVHHLLIPMQTEIRGNYSLRPLPPADGAEETRAVLEKYPNVKLVISGQTHLPGLERKNGITYLATPSVVAWPARYLKVTLNQSDGRVSQLRIPDQALAKEAHRRIIDPKSEPMRKLGGRERVERLYNSIPMSFRFSLLDK